MDNISFPNLGLDFMVNKVAFSIFGVDVAWYAVIITFGILVAMMVSYRNAKMLGLNLDTFMDVFFYMIVFGVIGARIYYVAFNFDLYKNDLSSILNLREGGIAIYGAIIFGAIAVYVYTKLKKQKFLEYTDCLVPALAIAQAIGRWGNFVNQEAFGYETNSLFAMRIMQNGNYLTVHPTFLYESALNAFIFIILMIFLRKFQKLSGETTYLYAICYGIGRFFIEGMRSDSLYIGSFRISQIVSILILIVGGILFIRSRYKTVKVKNSSQ